MKKLNVNAILFNAAGIGVVLVVVGYVVSSFFIKEEIARCADRYGRGEQFSLQNNKGELLTPVDLQARSSREAGILNNARVVAATDKSSAYLQVSMAGEPAPSDEDGEAEPSPNGIRFSWQPASFTSVRGACLSYRLFMSKDFSFAAPGVLPGLFAARELEDLDAVQPKSGAVTRLGWQKDGVIGVDVRTPAVAGTWLGAQYLTWPLNRWVSVEQEVVLNAPGKANGILRLWIDGELKINNTTVNLGSDDKATLAGVVSDIGYSQKEAYPGRLTVSPFLVRFQ